MCDGRPHSLQDRIFFAQISVGKGADVQTSVPFCFLLIEASDSARAGLWARHRKEIELVFGFLKQTTRQDLLLEDLTPI